MANTILTSSAERERLIQAFRELPKNEQQNARVIWEHLRYLWILWGLDEIDSSCTLTPDKKRHALLAYKSLQIVWFKKLPRADKQSFEIYIRDRVPEASIPAIRETFSASINELASRGEQAPRPKWTRGNAIMAKISIESFPHRME